MCVSITYIVFNQFINQSLNYVVQIVLVLMLIWTVRQLPFFHHNLSLYLIIFWCYLICSLWIVINIFRLVIGILTLLIYLVL